jgi:hypothetical protein
MRPLPGEAHDGGTMSGSKQERPAQGGHGSGLEVMDAGLVRRQPSAAFRQKYTSNRMLFAAHQAQSRQDEQANRMLFAAGPQQERLDQLTPKEPRRKRQAEGGLNAPSKAAGSSRSTSGGAAAGGNLPGVDYGFSTAGTSWVGFGRGGGWGGSGDAPMPAPSTPAFGAAAIAGSGGLGAATAAGGGFGAELGPYGAFGAASTSNPGHKGFLVRDTNAFLLMRGVFGDSAVRSGNEAAFDAKT